MATFDPNSLGEIRFYTEVDPYYYTVDNRPLHDLDENIRKVAAALASEPVDPSEYEISVTPKPNAIPLADAEGHLHPDWFEGGGTDPSGHEVSVTPKPNAIPLADADGHLHPDWFEGNLSEPSLPITIGPIVLVENQLTVDLPEGFTTAGMQLVVEGSVEFSWEPVAGNDRQFVMSEGPYPAGTRIWCSNSIAGASIDKLVLTKESAKEEDISGILGHVAEGDLAVETTVQKKLREKISPEDFRMSVDADDTLAFSRLETYYRHQDIDLNGRTYVVAAKPEGNRYFNGAFQTPTFKHYAVRPQPVSGAARPDYNYGSAVRYNIMEINGSTTVRGAQSFAFDDRTRSMYLMEGGFITRYNMDGPVEAYPLDASGSAATILGHQGLAVEYLLSGIRLWSTAIQGGRFACRFSYAAGTVIDTAEVYELFQSGSFANSASCTPTISYCGRYLVAHGIRYGTTIGVLRVFEVAKLVAGGTGDYSDKWLYEFETQGLHDENNPLQGIACDGSNIFAIAGGTGFSSDVYKRLHVFTLQGELIQAERNFRVGRTLAQADVDGTRYEPEGLAILGGAGGQMTLMSGILSGNPANRRFRIFGCGMALPVVGQQVLFPGNTTGSISSSTSTDRQYVGLRASYDLTYGSGTNWYGSGDSTQPGGLADFTGNKTRRVTDAAGGTLLQSDAGTAALSINMPSSGAVMKINRGTLQVGYINQSTLNWGLFATNGTTLQFATGADATSTVRWQINQAGALIPGATNLYSIGSGSVVVKDITLSVAPIVTSDVTYKQQWRDVSEAEKRVALKAKSMIQFFKLNDSVDLKNDGARWHIGVGAQWLRDAFAEENLNADEYAMFCYDEWEDEFEPVMATRTVEEPVEVERNGFTFTEFVETVEEYDTGEKVLVRAAGSRYAIRYEQLLAFIISAI